MRKIVHLSDVHFGRIERHIEEALLRDIQANDPDLLVVSGDLTQRARTGQFIRARTFFGHLSCPKIIVPGNHDIPLYNLTRRFLSPLGRFRKYITDDLSPEYRDKEIAVFGINSTRRFPFIMGRISEVQVKVVCDRIKEIPPDTFRAVVAHHPFLAPPMNGSQRIIGRAKRSLDLFADCGLQLILAGHFHQGYAGLPLSAGKGHGQARILIVQASTVSTRTRGEPNAYNLITIGPPPVSAVPVDPADPLRLELVRQAWIKGAFRAAFHETWRLQEGRWARDPSQS